MPSPRQVLREMLQQDKTIVAPGAYDPMGARVVQALGFPAVYTGGYVSGEGAWYADATPVTGYCSYRAVRQ